MKRAEGGPCKNVSRVLRGRIEWIIINPMLTSGDGCSKHTDEIQMDPDSYTSEIGWVFRSVFSGAMKGYQMYHSVG
jgi:hypothetical protein